MSAAVQAQLFAVALGVCVVLALYVGVAAIVGVIDGRRQARDRRAHAESDYWRTVAADPRQPRGRRS